MNKNPTMKDAIDAGNGTLHGAIDYWQKRALDAEATLEAFQCADETTKVLANNYLTMTCGKSPAAYMCKKVGADQSRAFALPHWEMPDPNSAHGLEVVPLQILSETPRVWGSTHKCSICGSDWAKNKDGTWSLKSRSCGQCCDNAPMGDQIIPLEHTK